jgi:hypothetical protein
MPFIFISPLKKFVQLVTNLDVPAAPGVVKDVPPRTAVYGVFTRLFRNSFATEGADNLAAEAFIFSDSKGLFSLGHS